MTDFIVKIFIQNIQYCALCKIKFVNVATNAVTRCAKKKFSNTATTKYKSRFF